MTELVRLSLEEIPADGLIEAAGREVRNALERERDAGWRKLRLPLLGSKVRDSIDGALAGVDPLALFAEAWVQIRELQKLPPGERSYVEIGEFSFEKDLHPVVTVSFPPWVSRDIPLTLTLSVKTDAVELEVFDRHIVAVGGGHCNLAIELKYESTSLSGPVNVKHYDLPGEHRFAGAGIAIPGSDASPAA